MRVKCRAPPHVFRVGADPLISICLDVTDQSDIESIRVMNIAGTVGTGCHGRSKLDGFLHCMESDIAGAGNRYLHAFKALAVLLQHALCKIDRAVPRRFTSCQRAAIAQSLACQHARLIPVGEAFELSEHVADFALANTDISRRHIGIFANMTPEFGHEGLAETHQLAIRASFRIEVGSALAATDWHAREAVLENLLKGEKLDDSNIHGRMEPCAPLIGTQGGIELNTESAIDPHLSLIIDPGDPENDLPFGFAQALDQSLIEIGRMLGDNRSQTFQDLPDRLVKFRFAGIALQDVMQDGFEFLVEMGHGRFPNN